MKIYHSLILKYNLYVTLLRKECTQLPMESKTGIKIHKGLSIQFYFPSVIVCGFAGFVFNKGYSHSGIFFAFAKINARVESHLFLSPPPKNNGDCLNNVCFQKLYIDNPLYNSILFLKANGVLNLYVFV